MPARGITTDCTAEEEDGACGTVQGSPQRASGEERRGWRWGGGEEEGRCPGETCSCKCVIRAQTGEGGRGLGGGRSMREERKSEGKDEREEGEKEKGVGGI